MRAAVTAIAPAEVVPQRTSERPARTSRSGRHERRPFRFLGQLEARRQLAPFDERVDLAAATRVQADVALTDALLLDEQARADEPLADRQRQRAVVAGEAAREVRDLGVVAAPLPHPD